MNGTLLLVEDDENDVFFFKRAMKLAGIQNQLQVAVDGREAIHYLEGSGVYSDRERFPSPELVLLDLKLPFVMGMDVLKWIRQQPALRMMIVLIFTSSKMPEDIQKAYLLGANSYLVKPSEPQELDAKVRLIKNYWMETNHWVPAPEWIDLPARSSKVLQTALL